jgi:rhodanese-related sulfurtransferase
VIIVDTRNADAYAQGHIPGAILLPLEGQLTWSDERQKTVVEPLKRAKKPIVTYCA